ncbi:MAG TPA: hypothetical protein VFH91_02190 [Pyrinomonadaceae bacterium]|nr:hypothetical protein [Pyrinomonadaceae bacterium]
MKLKLQAAEAGGVGDGLVRWARWKLIGHATEVGGVRRISNEFLDTVASRLLLSGLR